MTIRIIPNDKGNPPGKLADVELHFTEGPLEGLKLIGFAVWESRKGRNVTFPRASVFVTGPRQRFCALAIGNSVSSVQQRSVSSRSRHSSHRWISTADGISPENVLAGHKSYER
jgi:hypothetical protein